MDSESDKDLVLQALLAEYNALRTEIQNRSELQNRFIQLHVTAITIVVGLLLQDGFKVYPGFFVIIALSSSVFGLWWIDQAVTINRIGCHLVDPVEHNVNALVGTSALRWESEDRNPLLRRFSEEVMQRRFRDIVMLTYVIPAALAVAVAVAVVGHDMFSNPGSVFGFERIDVWIVALLIVFVAAILRRLWKARSWMIEVGDAVDCYKRRLRNEPLDDVCMYKMSILEDLPEWMAGQKQNCQILRGEAS